MNNKLRNLLIGAGIATVGAIGTKLAVDYFQKKNQKDEEDEANSTNFNFAPKVMAAHPEDTETNSSAEVAFATVAPDSVQSFLDASFGTAGRYTPNRPPKIFDYQGQQYMVIWAYDNQKNKKQMLAFIYTDEGRKMVASVGYTTAITDYNINLGSTPFAVEVNGTKLTSGQGETSGTNTVDFVLN